MTRKTKVFWIGALAPVIALWVWWYFAQAWVTPPMDDWTVVVFSGPAILVGGLAGMIASVSTSGPPMSRKAKAGLIGFYSPVIPGCWCVMFAYISIVRSDNEWAGLMTAIVALLIGGPSILLGLAIALIAACLTQNKPHRLECGKCGYSLVGLTSDKCPECGHTVRSTAPS